MHVGNAIIFQHPDGNDGDQSGDAGVYETEYKLADRVEDLGFDSLWGVEHHFDGYAMCPDPLKFLTYFAGRTERVKLGTMVVVAPWHDPIRVAEDSSVLDIVSGGRNILGIGRGVSKLEFDGFRLNMADSRQALIENTEATMMGLEKGYIEYDGEVVKQHKVLIRPGSHPLVQQPPLHVGAVAGELPDHGPAGRGPAVHPRQPALRRAGRRTGGIPPGGCSARPYKREGAAMP